MTREEKLAILERAQERAFAEIDETSGSEMGCEKFGRLLDVVQGIEWMLRPPHLETDDCVAEAPPDETPQKTLPKVQTEFVNGFAVSEVVHPEPAPENTAPEKTETMEPKYEMVEVRAALAKARSKGVNVSDIVQSFGVTSFPEIDAAQYPAVMAKLEEALNAT